LLKIEQVDTKHRAGFRSMVQDFWRELTPKSTVVNDPGRWEACFREQFAWDGGNHHPHWAVVDDQPVALMAFGVSVEQKRATVSSFCVIPDERRKGYGTMVALSPGSSRRGAD
jgi:hypothetical protein